MGEKQGKALVVGAGISGIRSALDLAESGCDVTLIDAAPHMGGVLSKLEYQFPTDGCGMCRMLPMADRDTCLQACLRKGLVHGGINLMLSTTLKGLEGEAGKYRVTLETEPCIIDPRLCTGCDKCSEVCPVTIPDSFNQGLSTTKAVHLPVSHAIPNVYTIDMDHCTLCGECETVCPFGAIHLPGEGRLELKIPRTRMEMDVGAVVLACGIDYYDPRTGVDTFGYKELKDVVSNIELERILSGTGPFEGSLKRPSDGKEPDRMAWIQCVGSRDLEFPACSSVCCMIALKEAVLVRKRSRCTIETVIYYMDMRCFSKEFEAYRRRAENEYGVILKKGRPHSVRYNRNTGGLGIYITGDSGVREDEEYDMVVLSLGQRPGKGVKELSQVTGIGLNPLGFFEEPPLWEYDKTGVFAAGSASGLKDIGESVIHSSSASAMALKVIHEAGSSHDEGSEPLNGFRDVSAQVPDIGVVLCQCPSGPDIEHQVRSIAARDVHVSGVMAMDRICTREGWDGMLEALAEKNFNRILVLACSPQLFLDKKDAVSRAMDLDPAYIDFADLGKGEALASTVKMGLARIRYANRLNSMAWAMVPKVLVAGGGIGGMTAALSVADSGFQAVLVERGPRLGGNLLWLDVDITGNDFGRLLENTCRRVENHPGIRVFTNTVIEDSNGVPGNYVTKLKPCGNNSGENTATANLDTGENDGKIIEHGAVILATGGREAETTAHGHGTNDAVMTNRELEQGLKAKTVDPVNMQVAVMIQCVDSRIDSREYCSRICCKSSLKNALEMKRLNPDLDIYVLYREMMSYGFSEIYFKEAREKGVIFIRYGPDRKPEVFSGPDGTMVKVHEPLLHRPMEIRSDLVVLATGIVPSTLHPLAALFDAEVDDYSFFKEADSKWRPVDAVNGGVFACGLALGPRDAKESMASARAAAMGAVRLISRRPPGVSLVTAGIKHSLCTLCERCIDSCVYGARTLDADAGKIGIDPVACQGCGSCAAVCTNSASFLNNYLDQQMLEIIDAAI
ncbi:MAG: CoB--CoM heterodisulfide reductase iron-sulfur subunit A family protein [Desulfobacteraceae bacterium]|nr:CoB--CoM heterodisulfide reductase iron-sulfur subunit A family protein [Desulfobacteraceae bacterium]